MTDYHTLESKEVLASLSTSQRGLSEKEAAERLLLHGPNVIQESKGKGVLTIVWGQLNSPVVWILIAALAVSAVLKEYIDVYVIAAVIVVNTLLGFIQEYRAEKAIAALKKELSPKATVIRERVARQIDASQLVPGDIILVEQGDCIPADARLLECFELKTDESLLTGESAPVPKKPERIISTAVIAERPCMIFAGTTAVAGRCTAVVAETGMSTEVGKIARMIEEAESPPTPLQKKLSKLAKSITAIVIAVAVLVFAGGLPTGMHWQDAMLAAAAIAVAAIPEGLPAVVTTNLALGFQRMKRRNVLVRNLPSVETLGACTVICTDKTGTLTMNEMTVRRIYADFESYNIQEGSRGVLLPRKSLAVQEMLVAGMLCNNAKQTDGSRKWLGDPTETAIATLSAKADLDANALNTKMARVGEIGFTSERKQMTTMHKYGKQFIAYSKGAPEIIMAKCSRVMRNGREEVLTPAARQIIREAYEGFAQDGLRVMGFAFKRLKTPEDKGIEKDMVFLGLEAMDDPPRKEVFNAVKKCREAGIKVVMITGDHLITAKTIAREIGLEGFAVTGEQLDSMQNFEEKVDGITVYARVNPEHKMKIINALKKRGHVVAMTGDGINDGPALKKADIGVAMGLTGTDVAREASHMVLLDDNFASIVGAVEEGRIIFDNIRKFVEYIISSNLGEVLVLFFGILLALAYKTPLPLIALQILWINLITDVLPALALGMEKEERDIMQRPPRKPEENIMSSKRMPFMLLISAVVGIGTIGIFLSYNPETTTSYARTMAFTTLVLFQLFNVYNMRHEEKSALKDFFENKYILTAVVIGLALQILVVKLPFFNVIFDTTPLALKDWIYSAIVASSCLIIGEIVKIIKKQ